MLLLLSAAASRPKLTVPNTIITAVTALAPSQNGLL